QDASGHTRSPEVGRLAAVTGGDGVPGCAGGPAVPSPSTPEADAEADAWSSGRPSGPTPPIAITTTPATTPSTTTTASTATTTAAVPSGRRPPSGGGHCSPMPSLPSPRSVPTHPRSTSGRDRRPRSRCQVTYAETSPLASRATRGSTSSASAHRPSSRAPSSTRVSGAGRAQPGGRQRAHTAPPSAGANAWWGPVTPQRAQSLHDGAYPATARLRNR